MLLLSVSQPAHARLLFVDDVFVNDSETYEIGSNDDAATTPLTLQFGGTNGETLTWDNSNSWFDISDDFSLEQNQLKNVAIDNLASAPLTPVAGQIYHDTGDTNTYIYTGAIWEDITPIASSTNTKVITVGTGLDYTTIAAGATYLNTLSGGIILLSAETHAVSAAVDLTNIWMIGKDATKTTIQISGSGQMDSFDTKFTGLTMDINAITDTMAIDVQSGSSSLHFAQVDFDILDSGDSLIDSNAVSAPTSSLTFIGCNETAGSGTILKTIATGNLNASSTIFISSARGNNLLLMDDWGVTIEGAGNVYTTGTITTVPANTIFVYPGMYLQGAVNSLPSGGSITILPGTHSITAPIVITNDNIEIAGYGDSSVISASGFTGGDTVAAIQIGAADGTAPVNGVAIRDLKVEVTGTGGSDIHGIRAAGGSDNILDHITVQKVSGTSGTGATARMGIQFIDGTATQLTRPVITNSVILGNGGSNYFTDGIHLTSDGTFTGVWGNDQGVLNALIEGNVVDYVRETTYVFVGVDDSSLFNNRSSRMGAGGGTAYGVFMGNATNVNMSGNVFVGSLSTTSIAVGIEPFNPGVLKEVTDSLFNNNVIDGEGASGLGFAVGFQIGNATNAGVHRNSFQNNTIRGASVATTTAITVRGNADTNTFSNNDIYGGSNAWDTGVHLQASTQDGNLVRGNRYTNVTTWLTDVGTATKNGVSQHRATTDPTINDDIGDGYGIGTIWINTSTDESFIMAASGLGAAVWNHIVNDGTYGTIFTLDEDNAGAGVNLDLVANQGSGNDGTIRYNAANTRWEISNNGSATFNAIQGANIFFGYDATGGQTINATEITINIDTTDFADANYSLATDQVTINETGVYQITLDVGAETTNLGGSTVAGWIIKLQENVGAGFVDIANSVTGCIAIELSNTYSCNLTIARSFAATDIIRVRADRVNGTTNFRTLADNTRLIIEKIR